jgi:hypothetical protein
VVVEELWFAAGPHSDTAGAAWQGKQFYVFASEDAYTNRAFRCRGLKDMVSGEEEEESLLQVGYPRDESIRRR